MHCNDFENIFWHCYDFEKISLSLTCKSEMRAFNRQQTDCGGLPLQMFDRWELLSCAHMVHTLHRSRALRSSKWKLYGEEFIYDIYIMLQKSTKIVLSARGVRHTTWFNSMLFEFCKKMIHSIFDSLLLYVKFNSKYYSFLKEICWFNSKDNSIQ